MDDRKDVRSRLYRLGFLNRRLVLLAALALLAIAPYYQSLGGGFVWDDVPLIVKSNAVRTLRPLGRFFRGDFWREGGVARQSGYFRPLTLLSFALERHLLGLSPHHFRIVNLILHVGVTMLAFLLLESILASRLRALAATALFAVHPVHVESVAWISGRTDLLASFFVLASLLLAVKRRSPFWFPLVAALFLASLLSKESAALLPLVVLIHPAFGNMGRRVLSFGACLLGGAVYLSLRLRALGVPSGAPRTLDAASEAAFRLLAYIWKCFDPRGLPIDYRLDTSRSGVGLLILVILAVAAAGFWSMKGRAAGLGAVFFVLALMPTLGFVPIRTEAAIRFLYLPLLGLCLCVAAIRLPPKTPRLVPPLLMVLLLALLGSLSRSRSLDFVSDEALFRAERRLSPKSTKAVLDLGETYLRQRRLLEATSLFRESAARLDSPRIDAALVRVLRAGGRLEEAEAAAHDAIARHPASAELHGELGLVLIASGYKALARDEMQKAIAIDQEAIEPRVNLALLYLERGWPDEAAKIVDEGLTLVPGNVELLSAKARAESRLGRYGEAVEILEKLTDRAPTRQDLWFQLCRTALQAGMYKTSRQACSMAAKLDRADAKPRSVLATLDALDGKMDQAVKKSQEAAALAPASVEIRLQEASLLARSGDLAGARKTLRNFLRDHGNRPGADLIRRQLASFESLE